MSMCKNEVTLFSIPQYCARCSLLHKCPASSNPSNSHEIENISERIKYACSPQFIVVHQHYHWGFNMNRIYWHIQNNHKLHVIGTQSTPRVLRTQKPPCVLQKSLYFGCIIPIRARGFVYLLFFFTKKDSFNKGSVYQNLLSYVIFKDLSAINTTYIVYRNIMKSSLARPKPAIISDDIYGVPRPVLKFSSRSVTMIVTYYPIRFFIH
jgi:hypothetical protein